MNLDKYSKNWRPLTLLNVLYKIISGCLSQRMKDTLHHIISETQSGFSQRQIYRGNTHFIYDILSFTELHNIQGLLVRIDFEKSMLFYVMAFYL